METWRKIPDFEKYEASTLGNIRNATTHRILTPQYLNDYVRVTLYKDGRPHNIRVHRLVAKVYIPNPENKPYIDHIDENKVNNHVDNLRWVTPSENMIHFVNGGSVKEKNIYLKFENDTSIILFGSLMKACEHFQKAKGTMFGAYRKSLIKENYKWNTYKITRATPEEIIEICNAK